MSLSKKTVLSSPAIMLTRSAQKTFLPEASLSSDRIEAVIITDDHAARATQTESFSLCGKTNQRRYRESSHNGTQRQKQWALPLGELFDCACEQARRAVTFAALTMQGDQALSASARKRPNLTSSRSTFSGSDGDEEEKRRVAWHSWDIFSKTLITNLP